MCVIFGQHKSCGKTVPYAASIDDQSHVVLKAHSKCGSLYVAPV